MLEEIVVALDREEGALARIGELLGHAGVNIETLSATTLEGRAIVHLVVDDGDDAAEALKANGFHVAAARPVLAVTLDDRPGELGRYCRRLADAGVTISAAYVARRGAGDTELIFAVDDIEGARRA
ncbi:MAG TPA: amino acid-binding protein [Actinomycetota bacterium]|nr:amino acid-binding protein [Actinomycetota bacterium]